MLVAAMLVVLPSALFAAGAAWCALLGASFNSWAVDQEGAAANVGD
jgi:hypothetical protein